VTVTPVNDPPVFLELPFLEVTEDQDFRFDLTPYIDDVDDGRDGLRLTVASPYAIIEGRMLTLRYTTEVGTDLINLSLSDGEATVSILLQIRVVPVNDGPVALPVPDLVTNEDTPLTLDLSAFAQDEEDGPDLLRWRAEGVPPDLLAISIDDQNRLSLSPLRDASGGGAITLVVRDTDGAESSVKVKVKVVPINDPPVISAIPDQAVKVNVSTQLDLRPYVSDVDNAISGLRVTAGSPYAAVLGLVITFKYPVDEVLGREVVRLEVSDGQAAAFRDITVELRFPPAFTGDPGIVTVGARKVVSVDLVRYVYDREDWPSGLKWALGSFDGTLLEAGIDGNGRLTVRSLGGGPASTSVEVRVTDTDGNSVNRTVQVMVKAPAPAGPGREGTDSFPLVLATAVAVALSGVSALIYLAGTRRTRAI